MVFNHNNSSYPTISVSEELLLFLNKEINWEDIIKFMNIDLPKYNPDIMYEYTKDFYFNGSTTNDKLEIDKFIKKYPIYTIKKRQSYIGKITYCALLNTDEKLYFSKKANYGTYYIDKFILPKKPSDYVEEISFAKNFNLFKILIIIFSIILFFTYRFSFSSFMFLLISFIIFMIYYYTTIEKTEKNITKIHKSTLEFENDLRNFKNKIEKIRETYRDDYKKKLIDLIQIAENNRLNLKPEIIANRLKSKVNVKKINDNLNRGKTEMFFLQRLYNSFNSQVSVDVIPDYGKNPFQPDFLLICKKTGVHIDIEIDEPYAVDNGKPIHHDRTNDNARNLFFHKLNWVVIRFSERQIIENTDECVNLIENVIHSLISKKNSFQNDVSTCKKWTYEEALLMSHTNYRNTYLPQNMKINLNYSKRTYNFESDNLPF